MGRHFLAIVRPPPIPRHLHMWEKFECLACGWDMSASVNELRAEGLDNASLSHLIATLRDVEVHVCPVVDAPHWLEVVRDAFLSGDDRRAITIIETMEPDKFRYAFQIGQLRDALQEAIAQIEEHNNQYQHVTANADIDRWKKIGGL